MTVFVMNLPFSAADAGLRGVFQGCGGERRMGVRGCVYWVVFSGGGVLGYASRVDLSGFLSARLGRAAGGWLCSLLHDPWIGVFHSCP